MFKAHTWLQVKLGNVVSPDGVILQEMNASELLVGPNDADSLLSRFPLPLRTADD